MVRLAPSEHYRFTQACPGSMDLTFGGAESSVAASISIWVAVHALLVPCHSTPLPMPLFVRCADSKSMWTMYYDVKQAVWYLLC